MYEQVKSGPHNRNHPPHFCCGTCTFVARDGEIQSAIACNSPGSYPGIISSLLWEIMHRRVSVRASTDLTAYISTICGKNPELKRDMDLEEKV